ncbi:MAG: hypothetical protein GXO43_04600 [Crenarchaeota archaeon]|nr:hypothetical protein [Thermoproteota archaeon]
MPGKKLLIEAKSTADRLMKRVDDRVLSKAAQLKPSIVSVAQRIYDLSSYLSAIFNTLAERIGKEDKEVLSFGPHLYLVITGGKTALIRSKPYSIIVSYDKKNSEITVKTRNGYAVFSPGRIVLCKLNMKIDFDPTDVNDIINKYPEIKYLLRFIGKTIEFTLVPLLEKRIGLTI